MLQNWKQIPSNGRHVHLVRSYIFAILVFESFLTCSAWSASKRAKLLYACHMISLQYPRNTLPQSTTEIYAVDPNGRNKKLLFTDAASSAFLQIRYGSGTHPAGAIVARGGKIIALATDRAFLYRHPQPEFLAQLT